MHIESKMSRRKSSEYDIYVNLENENGGDVSIPKLVSSLKRQFSYIQIEGENGNAASAEIEQKQRTKSVDKPIEEEEPTKDEQYQDVENKLINTENTEFINSNGDHVRKSKRLVFY